VYSSAAAADPKGLGPTIYAGSYDGDFYAFNARSGAVRWRHPAGGKISGSATVVGNVVYYADLATHTSTGLNVRTGEQVFSFADGAFTPVIADEHAVYLIGQGSIYQMLPGAKKHPHVAHRAAGKRSAGARRSRHRHA
jgi:outer membrane protein assembly factor BamB